MGNKPAMPDGPGFTIVAKTLKYLMWNSLAINWKSFKTLQVYTAGPNQNNKSKKALCKPDVVPRALGHD